MNKKINVGLFFGGRSTEHEVSVITALQAFENLDKNKYHIIPVYVSKTGQFFTNPKFLELKNYQNLDQLLLASGSPTFSIEAGRGGLVIPGLFSKMIPIDIAFPLFHGSFGEDGCIQGVFETYKIPYVGFNVLGSSLAMDKVISKAVFTSLGLPIGKYVYFTRADWNKDSKRCLSQVKQSLKFPVFVKPADLGSTIGINKATEVDSLSFYIEVAATYSDKILIEEAFGNCIEVNCAALGYKNIIASVCEMPVLSGDSLSFQDKYMRGGKSAGNIKNAGMVSLSRQVPATISQSLTRAIQDATVQVFKTLEGCGVARVDYFVDPKTEKFWINEVNSPPGSLAYYLFEPVGIKYPQLLDKVIEYGLERSGDQTKTQYVFQSGLLSQMASTGGLKR